MKAQFGKFGPAHDYRSAHVALKYQGRELLGTITNVYRMESIASQCGNWFCEVQHFCGDAWPITPVLSALEILERTYERPEDHPDYPFGKVQTWSGLDV